MMKKQLIIGLVGLGLLLAGCTEKPETTLSSTKNQESTAVVAESSSTSESPSTDARTITGVSGTTYSLDLPGTWQEVDDFESLNPDNDFMVSNLRQTIFLAAVTEPKEDFADFDTYFDLVNDSLVSTFNTDATFLLDPDTKVYKVDFPTTVEGINVHYLYYVMETENNFVQLYGWTLESDYEKSKDVLTPIMDSFQEVSQ